MGLFNRLFGKNKNNAEQEAEKRTIFPKAYKEEDAEERKQFVESYCKLMASTSQQLEEAKREYEAVTEALVDIQLLDEMEAEAKDELAQVATRVVELNAEREGFKEEQQRIAQNDYLHMMDIEDNIDKIIKRMEADENYCQAVRSDMHHLEGEKGSLKFELTDYEDKIAALGKFAKGLAIIIIVAVLILVVAVVGFAFDVTVAGSIIFLIVAVIGVIILCLYQNYTSQAKITNKKLNKAITLLNSTKIKYVNITNSLDAQYIKHNVHSAYELSTLYAVYMEVKEERMRRQKAVGALHKAEETLLEMLYEYKLKNPQVWTRRARALVDKREMVEVRHELNTSRQRLREQMDANMNVLDESKKQIMEFAKINSRHTDEIMQIVDSYKGL